VPAPAEFKGLDPANAAIAAEAMRSQQALLTARRTAMAQQKLVLGQQAAQSQARIEGYRAELAANNDQRGSIAAQLDGMRELAAKGFASKNNVRALERAESSLQGEVGSFASKIAEAREAIGQARMQSLVLDSNLIEEADQRLREVATRLNEVTPQRFSASERLAQTVVRAPASGRVVGLSVFTVGGVVSPGQLLMNVVPENRELVVQAQFSPDDADDISPGMLTEVRFPTLRDANLPTIDGTLVTVSADAVRDERTGTTYFTGEVRVPAAELRAIEAARPGRPSITSGLPVEVLVKLEHRTMLSYLVEPLMRASWRTGREH
jgi:HlyD family type I secretion membrane fusion protein